MEDLKTKKSDKVEEPKKVEKPKKAKEPKKVEESVCGDCKYKLGSRFCYTCIKYKYYGGK